MTQTIIQKAFRPFKQYLPAYLSNPIRSIATAFITPVLFSIRSGHFKSSFNNAAVARNGEPLPWYTYPSIDFLKFRDFSDKTILEFGGGQSSLWWAQRARRVVTFEGDKKWFDKIRGNMPANVDLHLVSMNTRLQCVQDIDNILNSEPNCFFDIVIIDGLYREQMPDIACRVLASDGCIICDNADGYEFYQRLLDRGLQRVDFFGYAPGVVLPHCTSLYFRPNSYLFDSSVPIPVIVEQN